MFGYAAEHPRPGEWKAEWVKMKEEFTKHDEGKAQLAIIFDQPLAIAGVARVLHFGAKKYGRKNWFKVEDRERYLNAALRHICDRINGVMKDEESGENSLEHAIACLLFVDELDRRDEQK